MLGTQMKSQKISAEANTVPLRKCEHCNSLYAFHKSTSRYLKLTYCGMLCEIASLGFSIEAAISMTRTVKLVAVTTEEKAEERILPFALSQNTKGDAAVGVV